MLNVQKHNLKVQYRSGRELHIVDMLKGTATLMITMFYMKDLNKP